MELKRSIAAERVRYPAAGVPGLTREGEAGRRLNITVLFTSVKATLAALNRAAALAKGLNSRITLFVSQAVPYSLPLDKPPVLLTFRERQLRELAAQSPVETTVRLYLCRDPWRALTAALRPSSLVVVGVRRGWWPTREKSLVRKLRRTGYEVAVIDVP